MVDHVLDEIEAWHDPVWTTQNVEHPVAFNPRKLKSPYPVDASALRALKRDLLKRVGELAAGWNADAQKLGVKLCGMPHLSCGFAAIGTVGVFAAERRGRQECRPSQRRAYSVFVLAAG